ncbi:MAG: ral nucleoside transport system permease protein [Pseudonocardiales bacterium]|jgi:simple sugar transport system permease protein|nr:ral nucleoside transport system permease protein [Pseudonocardiales bacterium]MDT4928295.1 ral nucleoside transport system permease protein [Pseudonocardiales bacterium]MDT4951152.1 ral nucleoside transport system permease protein [Pseudonocardiales bacterium]
MRDRLKRLLLNVFAAILAALFAGGVTSLILLARGDSPTFVISQMWDFGTQASSELTIVNSATVYFLSAIAVAIGFRMNLFNIGVDGQYRLAAMLAGAFAGSVALPNGLRQVATIIVAMLVGAAWAGLVAVLKVYRGVSEVISTIMLNFIATSLIAYLMRPTILGHRQAASNDVTTKPIPGSGQVKGIDLIPHSGGKVYGLIVLAVIVGVVFQFGISRTRFGFDLRAAGRSLTAAQASGVNVKKMIIVSLLLSGAVAGLVGMPALLGDSHSFSAITFQSGLGFTGIAIALLGRNTPIGIAFAALLWAFLDQSATILDLNEIPKEIVQITQGIVVLSVVIAYEVVRRVVLVQQQRRVGRALATPPPAPAAKEVAA